MAVHTLSGLCRAANAILVGVLAAYSSGIAAAPAAEANVSGQSVSSALAPLYKPSSNAPVALDIRKASYGGSRSAPNALTIGDRVADFVLPQAGGGEVQLAQLRAKGDVALIFYRGHW